MRCDAGDEAVRGVLGRTMEETLIRMLCEKQSVVCTWSR